MTSPDPARGIRPTGYRLPEGTRVGPVRLRVRDLDRSVHFYAGILGLALVERDDDTAALGARGGTRPLVRLLARPGLAPAPPGGRFGLYHFALLLPDRAALGRVVAHLRRARLRAGFADHAVSEAVYLQDPDNLGIEVYADRPRAAWTWRDGELVMTTEPLDVDDLIAAAGGASWEGAPAGTTMGHVHLHVGDLDRADAFYRLALGFDKTVWSYPGALFFSAGGYHHHLGTNVWSRGPSAREDEAGLVDWTLVVPTPEDADGAAESLRAAGHPVARTPAGWRTADPWGTPLVITAEP